MFVPPSLARRPLRLAAAVVFVLLLPLYVATANRHVGFIDRGELAAVATTLGVAHPTGYPLFTLLGHLATRLVPARPVLVLNVLAALLAALGAAALVALYDELLRRGDGAPGPAGRRATAAAAGALLTATGTVWWQQANGWEVYALQALLLPAALALGLRWLRVGGLAAGLAFAFALGLTFTNHLTAVLTLPALAALLLADPRRGARLRECLPMAGAFAIALTLYAYLPLRAAQHPLFDWNEPTTLARFVGHVTGREFRSWMFANGEEALRQMRYVSRRLPGELTWPGFVLALAGFASLARRDPRGAIVTLLLLVACVVYACGYGIRDIDAYLLTAVLALGAWAASAAHAALGGRFARIALPALAVLVLANAALHRDACDEHDLTLPEDMARAQLEALPPNAVLFDAQWDYTLSASLYLQEVEHVRPDVTVIGTGTLPQPWYVRSLRRRDPALMAPAASEVDAFLAAATPYEEGRAFDAAAIGRPWQAMIDRTLEHALATRPVFATAGVPNAIGARFARVPVGPCFRIVADSAYVPALESSAPFRPWRRRLDSYVATTSWIRAVGCASRAQYEWRHGRSQDARRWLEAALRFDPRIDLAHVPAQPLDGDELVRNSAELFEQLHASAGR